MIVTTWFFLASLLTVPVIYLYWKLNHVPRINKRSTPAKYNLSFRTVSIQKKNKKHLFGWYIPGKASQKMPCMLVMHGWCGNASSLLTFAPILHNAGLNLLFLDASNHGQSSQNGQSSIVQFSKDINDGLEWLVQQPEACSLPPFIMGHSNAAAGALLSAVTKEVQGIIAISAFSHSIPFLKHWIKANTFIPFWPIGWIVIQCMQLRLMKKYNTIAPINIIKNIEAPILFVHGENDVLSPILNIEKIQANAKVGQAEVFKVSDAGHNSIPAFRKHAHEKIPQFIFKSIEFSKSNVNII